MVAARIGDAIDAAEHYVARSPLNPYDADTIAQMGYLLVLRGSAEEGIAWMDRAVRLNPLHPDWYHFDRSMALLPARRLSWRRGTSAQNPKAGRLGFGAAGNIPGDGGRRSCCRSHTCAPQRAPAGL